MSRPLPRNSAAIYEDWRRRALDGAPLRATEALEQRGMRDALGCPAAVPRPPAIPSPPRPGLSATIPETVPEAALAEAVLLVRKAMLPGGRERSANHA